ncbi:MAG TPA: hypothetical protein VG870_02715 [Chitinophagaceae bacterium]|nr:hypothetical protein [Chitinophagaceae bacterium]
MKHLLWLSCWLWLGLGAGAQQFGGNPPSHKWEQIQTDTVRVIYPAGLDAPATDIARVVSWLARRQAFSLGPRVRRIDIVLQNQTTLANGYVGLGPFRSEFQMTPDPDNFSQGSLPWPRQLAVHEYRHVMQYNNFRHGLSRLFYYLFGEDGYLVAANGAVPDWFFEGDAVYNETVLTGQGRGRIPAFMNTFPSLWLAGRHDSYMKLRNGSLHDYVPNHYNLGYLLVNYGRQRYGGDFWTRVTRDAAAYRGLFYPFQRAERRYAGVDFPRFTREAFAYYRGLVGDTSGRTPGRLISVPDRGAVTSYRYPYQLGGDSLVYLKTSYRRLACFVMRDAAGEHRIRLRDISAQDQFSCQGGRIVYAAYRPDARWAWRDYSELRILDIHTGRQHTLTRRSKLFSPDLSADGSRVVAVEMGPQGGSSLQVLDASSGQVLRRITSPEVAVFTDPKFAGPGLVIAAARLPDGQMRLVRVDLAGGTVEGLTPPSPSVLGQLSVDGDQVFFTASYGGNDDLYALRLADHRVFRLTEDYLGDYEVNARQGKLVFARFTAGGYELRRLDPGASANQEMNPLVLQEAVTRFPVALAGQLPRFGLVAGKDNAIDLDTLRRFATHRYGQSTRLLHFHSWRPYYQDPDFTFSLYGENILNTLQTQVYYHYNQNDRTSGIGASAVYGALFPYVTAGTEYTFQRQDSLRGLNRTWAQLDSRLGLLLPLNLSGGRTYRYLTLGTNYVLRNEYITGTARKDFSNDRFGYLYNYLLWQQTLPQAVQQIYPRWGYSLSAYHRYALGRYQGYQLLGSSTLYLPGLAATHSLLVSGSFQQRDTTRLLFSNSFAGPRGYSDYYFSRMWRLSANYHLPLVYPDWGFGNLLYIQRARANLFYDYGRVYSNNKLAFRNLRSLGAELYLDTRWWNEYPLSFGLRFSHLLDHELAGTTRRNVVEFILPVSILPR